MPLDTEQFLLEPDEWIGRQDPDSREGIQSYLNVVPEPERQAAKQRLGSMFAVAETYRADIYEVKEKWDTFRDGHAEKMAASLGPIGRGEWLAAKGDDAKFYALLKRDAERRRDERLLLAGPDAPVPTSNPARFVTEFARVAADPAAFENSLQSRALEAAYAGKPAADAFTEWQEANKEKAGYDSRPAALERYEGLARQTHAKLTEALGKVRPRAEMAYEKMAKARDVIPGEGGAVDPFEQFRDLNPDEQRLGFRIMKDLADKNGDKGFLQATGEALYRGGENAVLGSAAARWRDQIIGVTFKEGDMVLGKDLQTELEVRPEAMAMGGYERMVKDSGRRLSAEEAAEWNKEKAVILADLNMGETFRKFSQEGIDSTRKGGGFFRNSIWLPSVESVPLMASMVTPAGLVLNAQMYQNDNYLELKRKYPAMSDEQANGIARVSGWSQSFLDKADLAIFSKGFPKVTRSLREFSMTGGALSRFAVNTGTTFGAQYGIELVQDHIVPAAVQDLMNQNPAFDVRWGEVMSDLAAAAPETAMGMLLISAVGGAHQTRQDSKFVQSITGSKASMMAWGYSAEQIAEIQAAPVEQRPELLAKHLPKNAPTGAEKDALVAATIAQAKIEQADLGAKVQAENIATAEAADYAIHVLHNGENWQVQRADGKRVDVSGPEAARALREDLRQAATQAEADAFVALAEDWMSKAPEGTRREVKASGDLVQAVPGGVERTRDGQVTREILSADDLAELHRESQMDARESGNEAVNAVINGSNVVEFGEKIEGAARQIVQRLEINQSPSAVLTFLHESIEADLRAGLGKGTVTESQIQKAIASIAPAFKADTALGERIQKVARGEASATELRETLSELAVADVIGRRRDGSTMPVGAVTAALDAAIRDTTNKGELKQLGKFRAFLRSVRQFFRGLFGAVAALKNARRSGLGKDFDAVINKITGKSEQAIHDKAATGEAEAMAKESELDYTPPTEEERAAGMAFSVSTGSQIDAIRARMDAALARDPKARRDIGKRGAENLERLKRQWETERWTPKGDTIRPIVEKRSPASLDKEQAFRQAARREELEGEVYSRHGDILQNPEFAKIWNGPVMSWIARPGTHLQGRLKSETEAAKSEWFSKKVGDYDGADGIPRVVFGGDRMPDQMAQELFDEGLISEPTADAMWDAIRQEVAQAEQWKKFLAAAKEELKRAKHTAREEAFEWRREQDEMQAEDWNPKERLLRMMRMLDAVLSVLPPEIRGKVGGFIKLASLGTDKARAAEIERRIEKMSQLLEKHLQKEATEQMRELLESAAPDREPGKQARGKLGAEAHRYFDAVSAVMDLTEEQVTEQRAAIEAAYAAPTLTDAQALDLFEREQILDAFGAWEKKSAADMDRALQAAQSVYDTGRNRWRAVEEARLGEVSAMADQVIEALGGGGYAGIQAQKDESGAKLRFAKKLALDLKSFGEVLDSLLGKDHPLRKRWEQAAREGFAQRNNETNALRKRWRDAVESATGLRGVKALRAVWDMGNVQTIKAPNVGAAQGKTQTVPISLVDEWIDGAAEPDALGFSAGEADQLIAEREAMAPDDRRQNLSLTRVAREGAETVPMTQAEGIFLTMLAAQEQYADALGNAGFTAEAVEEIEKQLTKPAKAMRDFMRTEYRDGYAPLAATFERMFGVALPQISNYAPAAFYHQGAEREMSLDGGGVGKGMRAGFLANRKQHTAAPRIENAFATFFGHASQAAHWKGLAEFVREFSGVMSKPDVKRAIEARHGKEMLSTLTDWTRNLEGNGLQKSAGALDRIVGWMVKAQTFIALSFRLGTLLKQSTAILGAAYRMPIVEYAKGFAKLVTGQLEFRKMLKSDVIRRRLESGFAPEVRAALNDVANAKPSLRQSVIEKGMELIGATDAFFTAGSAAIAFDYHLRKAKEAGLSGAAAEAEAMREVEEIVARTAQPSDVVDRSLFEARQGQFGRLLFLFASEARQKSSLWLSAWGNTLTGKATRADLRVLAIAHLIVGPMLQVITAAWRDARDDDDNEWLDQEHWNGADFLKSIVAGPLGGIPLVGSALSGFRDDGIFGRVKRSLGSGVQLFKGPEEKEPEKAEWYVKKITQTMQGLDAFTGVAGSVADQAFSIADNFLSDTDEEADKKERAQIRRERKEAREANE